VRDERYGGFIEQQGGTMFSLDGCRASGRGWTPIIARTLLASAFLLGVTTAITAQPILVETMVESGNFNPFGDKKGIGCSNFSPQFQNLPVLPPNIGLGSPADALYLTVPSGCKNTIMDWPSDVGPSPTDGTTVTKTFILSAPSPKALTVLSANGVSAAPGNIKAGKADGWACQISGTVRGALNRVDCTRLGLILPGQHYPAIVLSVLVESFFHAPPELNIYSTVSGGGALLPTYAFDVVDTFPGTRFCFRAKNQDEEDDDEDDDQWTPKSDGMVKVTCTDTRLTVKTVPPGLDVIMDGSRIPTDHTFFYYLESLHTAQAPSDLDGKNFFFSSGLTTNDPGCVKMPDTTNTPPVWLPTAPPDVNCIFDGSFLVTRPNFLVVSNSAGGTTGKTLANTFAVWVQPN